MSPHWENHQTGTFVLSIVTGVNEQIWNGRTIEDTHTGIPSPLTHYSFMLVGRYILLVTHSNLVIVIMNLAFFIGITYSMFSLYSNTSVCTTLRKIVL